MVELVLSAEQARLLAESQDAQGNRLGFFARRFSDGDIETARRRAALNKPGRSTADILQGLRALETDLSTDE
jgi:hypothetical protein